jgi:hypothetical protein
LHASAVYEHVESTQALVRLLDSGADLVPGPNVELEIQDASGVEAMGEA